MLKILRSLYIEALRER